MKRFKKFLKGAVKPSEYVKMFSGIGKQPDLTGSDEKKKSKYVKMFSTIKRRSNLEEAFKDEFFLSHLTPSQISSAPKDTIQKLRKHSEDKPFGNSVSTKHIDRVHKMLSNHYQNDSHDVRNIKNYTIEGGQPNTGYHKWNKALYAGTHDSLPRTDRDSIGGLKKVLTKHTTPRKLTVYSGVSRSPERHFDKFPDHDHVKAEFPAFTSTSLRREIGTTFAKKDDLSEHKYDHSEHQNAHGSGEPFSLIKKGQQEVDKKLSTHPPKKLSKEEYNGSFRGTDKHNGGPPPRPMSINKHHYNYSHVLTMHVPKGAHGAYIAHHSSSSKEREFLIHPGARFHIKKTPLVDHHNKTVHWESHMVHDGVKDVGDHDK